MTKHELYGWALLPVYVLFGFLFIGDGILMFLPAIILAISFGVASILDDRTRELRKIALLPISEWPEVALKQFKWMCHISPQFISREEAKEYYHRANPLSFSIRDVIAWSDFIDSLPEERNFFNYDEQPEASLVEDFFAVFNPAT